MNAFKNITKKGIALFLAAITLFSIPVLSAITAKTDPVSDTEFALTADAADASVKRRRCDAAKRFNTLITNLNGKYFTTTQRAVSSSKTGACYNANVIGCSWLKNLMGLVPNKAALMPEHYYSKTGLITSNAWSCAGFVNYALWYIYADKASDNVKRVNVYTGRFTKTDLDKAGLWPGDVIRIDNSHSVLYVSHSDKGMTVLDSNWNYDNKVQLHTILYTWHKNGSMACTRGTNYSTKSTYFNCSFRMKSGAYTNAYSNSACTNYVGRVYPGDVVTVKRVAGNVVTLVCPWTGGVNKTVYCRVNELKFKATKYVNAYSGVNGDYVGRIYPNDLVSVGNIFSSGYMVCECPWSGNTVKPIFIRFSEIY